MVVIAQGEASAAESLRSPRWATLADVEMIVDAFEVILA